MISSRPEVQAGLSKPGGLSLEYPGLPEHHLAPRQRRRGRKRRRAQKRRDGQ